VVRRAWPVAIAALAASLAAWADQARPNVVLITLDTTRADHLGSYGYRHARTPNLDTLARNGARFANADASAPLTLPSHATILTGLFPPRHGVRDNGLFVLGDRFDSVAELLGRAGYDTAAAVSAAVLARTYGLAQGFRLYDDDRGRGDTAGTMIPERDAALTTDAALRLLAGLRAPFFLWVHYFDPHEEYRAPASFVAAARGPTPGYDAEIAFMDEQIGRLLAAVPTGALVIAVGDHGEMLGEHGERTHGLLPLRGARRVPLILNGVGIPAARVVSCLVRTVDIAPTLLAAAGVSPSQPMDGVSLLSLLAAEPVCDRITYCESLHPYFLYRFFPLRALGNDRWVCVRGPTTASLYDARTDQEESHDLAAAMPEVAARWSEKLETFLAAAGETVVGAAPLGAAITEEQREQLRSLGYLSGAGGGSIEANLPDPRDMVDLQESINEAGKLVVEGKCGEAVPALEAVLRRHRTNAPALNLLGQCYESSGAVERALQAFRGASSVVPGSGVPVTNAAGCLVKLGRLAEAEKEYRRALELDPSIAEASAGLARLLRARGDIAGALGVLDAALAGGVHHPVVYLERGLTRAALGDVAAAEPDFREASRRDPANPVPLENLARAVYYRERYGEAAVLYEQLARLQPGRGEVWKTLGAVYLYKLDDRAGASRCFRNALRLEPDASERATLAELIASLDR